MPTHPERNSPPPPWADRLLAWLCPPELLEEMQGDLHERYHEHRRERGGAFARRQYWRDVLGFLRPYFLKRKPNRFPKPLYTDMLKNYLTTTRRLFWKQKSYALLNLSGLALGLTTSLLILLWVRDELSYDQYHEKLDRLYFVWHNIDQSGGQVRTVSDSQGPLAPALLEEMPEVANAARLTFSQNMLFTVGEKRFKEEGRYADPALFEMFSFPLVAGNRSTVLRDPTSIVISDSLAYKYFGGVAQSLGQAIRVDNQDSYTVTGVFRTIPQHSSQRFNFLLPFELRYRDEGSKNWGNSWLLTYVELKENASLADVQGKLRNFIKKRVDDAISSVFLQPLAEVHLYDRFEDGRQAGGQIGYVRLFGVVAGFILLIACVNFMNLATARSMQRAKEVGVRKSVGASRRSLIGQFITESMVLSVLAAAVALLLVQLLLPVFNGATDKRLVLPVESPSFWGMLGGITLLTGLVAGSYPALMLSSFKPVQVLKGTLRTGSGAAHLRQGLVVFQFVLSMIMIVATIVVYRQVQFIRSHDIGLQRENLLHFGAAPGISKHFEAYRAELLKQPGVQGVTRASHNPIGVWNTSVSVEWPGKQPKEIVSFQILRTDYGLLPLAGIKLKDGRDFSRSFPTDSAAYLINEEAARRMGMRNPVGQPLTVFGQKGTIIGLVKNFHSRDMHVRDMPTSGAPLVMMLRPAACGRVLVRTQAGMTAQAIAGLETLHRKYAPAEWFEYKFTDEDFEQMYRGDVMVGKLANGFSCIAIFISCLGLFGLAAFTAEKRTKEIGIRKVLGASVTGITALLSKDFLKLVLVAVLVASPLAWYAMNEWLSSFTYRITIGWSVFVLAGGAALLVALLTVSFQAVKAALANPVHSLKSE